MTKTLSRNALPLLLLLLVTGCVSGYSQFYKPVIGSTAESISAVRAAPPPAIPLIERSAPSDSQTILDAYAKRGFILMGSSMFNSGRPESDDSAIAQAKTIGADLVLLLNPKYTGTVTTSIPITTPTTSTSYSSGSAVVYGSAGAVRAYGSGTTTTYGSTTTYVPLTINRSDYGALYFIKQKFSLGAFYRDLNEIERQELQTNRGAAVRLVVDATPAFNEDLLVDDIVTSVDGVVVVSSQNLTQLLRERRGKQITLSILRKGQRLEKLIRLNS